MIMVPSGNPPSSRRLRPTIPVERFFGFPVSGMSWIWLFVSAKMLQGYIFLTL
jgi:hypothetical protein